MSVNDPFTFPHGEMIGVLRRKSATPGRYGAIAGDTHEWHHDIGPCAVTINTSSDTSSEYANPGSPQLSGVIAAPFDSDVLPDDRLRLANGMVVNITGLPLAQANQLTGWRPRMKITVDLQRYTSEEDANG